MTGGQWSTCPHTTHTHTHTDTHTHSHGLILASVGGRCGAVPVETGQGREGRPRGPGQDNGTTGLFISVAPAPP